MRYFDIYLMEEEITRLYLGKEDLLYRLFIEAKYENNQSRQAILNRQITFITREIAYPMLRRFLFTQHIIETTKNRWVISQNDGMATLSFAKNYLVLEASGELSAETAFFEILRHAYPDFFAIDYQNRRGAWLTPQRKHILGNRKMIL